MRAAVGRRGAGAGERTGGGASDVKSTLADARRLIDEGKPKEAIARLQSADATAAEVTQLLGVAYYHADEHQKAIATLSAVRDRLPARLDGEARGRAGPGLCYYLTGEFGDAIPLLEETRAWADDNLELGHILGLSYIQTRQPDQARASLARTFRVPPGPPPRM